MQDARTHEWSKPQLLTRTRNTYPDAALPWVDACWTPRGTDAGEPVTINPALGTGGNIGRADLGVLMARRVLDVQTDSRSRRWLNDALLGGHETPLVTSTEGHLGAIGLVNPWRWLLAMEGLIGLCSIPLAGLRPHATSRACPVVIPQPSPAGTANVVEGESTHELWLPIWERWLSWTGLVAAVSDPGYLAVAAHDSGGFQAARLGINAVTAAAAQLPVPLTAVARYHCVVRNGQNPFYLPGAIIAPRREWDADDRLTIGDLAAITGLDRKTITGYRSRRQIPEADGTFGGQPYWFPDGPIRNWIITRRTTLPTSSGPDAAPSDMPN